MNEAANVTFIDLYYKGFHVGVTARSENKPEPTIQSELYEQATYAKLAIDDLVSAGFEPSWNKETNKAQTPATAPQAAPQTTPIGGITMQAPVCPLHNKSLTLRDGKYGPYWSCSTKLADDTWCPYKPPKK